MRDVKVSIICNAYNHEKYISEALESFVAQKTNFKFEILVHDDASTDHTAEIIREYENKYPDLIKPVYQKDNIYSKNKDEVLEIQYGRALGKYIALCEGDDCWCDELKLQKQFDILERHPEIDMCAHRAYYFDCEKKTVTKQFPDINEERILSTEEVIYGEGWFLATNSLFYRKSIIQDEPMFKRFWNIDYTLQIQGSLRGGIYYLPDIMSKYRYMTSGSWSAQTYKNIRAYELMHEKKQRMLDVLNVDTQRKYMKTIELRKLNNEFEYDYRHENYKAMLTSKYKPIRSNIKFRTWFGIFLKAYFPSLYKIICFVIKKK